MNTGKYKIVKNLPIQKGNGVGVRGFTKYKELYDTFFAMEEGDCIPVSTHKEVTSLFSLLSNTKSEFKIITRKQSDGTFYIWKLKRSPEEEQV